MGVSIHFRFKSEARDRLHVRALVVQLYSAAIDFPFERVGPLVELEGPACDFRQCRADDPRRWMLIQAAIHVRCPQQQAPLRAVAPLEMIAFSTWPGRGCEPANFGLCRYPNEPLRRDPEYGSLPFPAWQWRSFCKTQNAHDPRHGGVAHFLRCHLTVIRLLDEARWLGILAEVHDEAGYWQDRCLPALAMGADVLDATPVGRVSRLRDFLGEDAAV